MTIAPRRRIAPRLMLAALCAGASLPAHGQTPNRSEQIIELQLRSADTRPEGVGISGHEADAIYQKFFAGGDHHQAAATAATSAPAAPGQ